MVAGAFLLSWATSAADEAISSPKSAGLGWIYTGNAEGAREVLSAVTGSMITAAALVFSMVVVVLTLASSQFGPRILRTFMRDKANQVVLGTFVSTFLYALLVQRLIRYDGDEFVPHLSVTVALLLAFASIGVLIFFIHHTAGRIQAPRIAAAIGNDLQHALEHLFPERIGEDDHQPRAALDHPPAEAVGRPIFASETGYLQTIVQEDLMAIACRADVVIRLDVRPGQFIVARTVIAKAWPAERFGEQDARAVSEAFECGSERTHTQDVLFVQAQLVEVAVRALSPGINDPFTALNCIDQLGAGLCTAAQRHIPSPLRVDHHGKLRVIAEPVRFDEMVDQSFRQIGVYGCGHVMVVEQLLETMVTIASFARRAGDRSALLHQARLVLERSRHAMTNADDQDRVVTAFERAREALGP